MWDKKTLIKHTSDKNLLKKLLAMLLVLILVLGMVALFLFRDEIRLEAALRRIKYWGMTSGETADRYSFDAHNSNCYAHFDGGLVLASVSGLSAYGSDGRETVVSQGQLNLPQVYAGKNLAMAYDAGGNMLLAVHKSEGEVLRVTSEKPILDADLSPNGNICYISSEAGYKSVITVYNEKQEQIYRWLSTSTFMPVAAVSENGKDLAAIGLNENDGNFASVLNLFRTDTDHVLTTVSLGSDLIYDLLYLNKDCICAIGETGISFVSASGEMLGTYAYNNSYLKDYDTGGDGFLALSMNTYRAGNRYTLVIVDEMGKELGSIYVGQEILDISAAGKYIAVLTTQGLTIYDRKLSVYAQTDNVNAATNVLVQPDGVALLLGAGKGWLYIP